MKNINTKTDKKAIVNMKFFILVIVYNLVRAFWNKTFTGKLVLHIFTIK